MQADTRLFCVVVVSIILSVSTSASGQTCIEALDEVSCDNYGDGRIKLDLVSSTLAVILIQPSPWPKSDIFHIAFEPANAFIQPATSSCTVYKNESIPGMALVRLSSKCPSSLTCVLHLSLPEPIDASQCRLEMHECRIAVDALDEDVKPQENSTSLARSEQVRELVMMILVMAIAALIFGTIACCLRIYYAHRQNLPENRRMPIHTNPSKGTHGQTVMSLESALSKHASEGFIAVNVHM